MADDLQAGADQTTSGADLAPETTDQPVAKKTTKKSAARKSPAKKTAATTASAEATSPADESDAGPAGDQKPPAAKKAAAKKATAKKSTAKKATAKKSTATKSTATKSTASSTEAAAAESSTDESAPVAPAVLFQTPEVTTTTRRRTRTPQGSPVDDQGADRADQEPAAEPAAEADAKKSTAKKATKKATAKKATAKKATAKKATAEKSPATTPDAQPADRADAEEPTEKPAVAPAEAPAEEAAEAAVEAPDGTDGTEGEGGESGSEGGSGRRRRRRGGRRRRKSGDSTEAADAADGEDAVEGEDATDEASGESSSSRRRRRRRRAGEDGGGDANDDPENTVTRVRSRRAAEDEITAVSGSTRLEAKKQRRREGREAGRRRAPIVSEAEFLARREAVDRVMVIRQRGDLTQIGVLEDRVLVEHYVARESQTSLIGNVYLGRVQNVLPSMEAAFIDIGKGRNAVLYAGEVNWSALGHKEGQPRKIESVLSSGQSVLVQVTKDPIGHKGARLSSQVSLAGRFLVYVPDGTTSGISRKLPDTERNRLKSLLKEIVPDTAGVIVRTAAEGASEDELTHDVERLKARWEDIEAKARGNAPQLLYGEPDLTLKVVRDLFTEDFAKLVIQGDEAWETVQEYVAQVAPDLQDRLVRYDPGADGVGGKADVFAEYRIEEQIAKGLDRKVWLPSGGSLVIDRTEAMTVIDVNTGKFTGSGGNLEETVTRNNLEAAEEIVRQLRLRDIGGIIVVDFIDMVLESNRDLVLRRLVECLGRDRTRHQVAEVTSLGLVQMTRKRIGTGLLEAFSETCEHCQGRGLVIHDRPVEARRGDDDARRGGSSGRRGRRGRGGDAKEQPEAPKAPPSPKDVAAMAARLETTESSESSESDQPVTEPAAEVPADDTLPDDTLPEEVPVEDTLLEEVPVEEAPTEQIPETPTVTTRTRRRRASRPAGQPTSVTEELPEPTEAQAVEAPVAEAPVEVEAPAAPEPPKVVTRTRGRAASRPAGPPEHGTAEAESAAHPGGVAPDAVGDEHPHVEHVPIKKKGSRKR